MSDRQENIATSHPKEGVQDIQGTSHRYGILFMSSVMATEDKVKVIPLAFRKCVKKLKQDVHRGNQTQII